MDQTLQDLSDDFTELSLLARSARRHVYEYLQTLELKRTAYSEETYRYLHERGVALEREYETLEGQIVLELNVQKQWNLEDVARLIEAKKTKTELLRVLQSSIGSVLAAGNWQSPSFAHTISSQAGNREGEVQANIDDYTRDRYPDEERYAQLFVQEYVDHGIRLPPRALLTSSCMAALTTVLTHARTHMQEGDVVFAGSTIYFQNKWVIEEIFPGKVIYVDEFDTDGILTLAQHHQPLVVLLDSLSGTDALALPNLQKLIHGLARVLPRRSLLVLDVTATATLYQPLVDLPINPFGMQIAMIASLSKYYQCGFDRVTAGIIWAPVGSCGDLLEARMHLGTIISDASLYTLPIPDRAIFDVRLRRIERNARRLAEHLDAYAKEVDGPVLQMVYPSLPSYRGYAWTQNAQFQGGVCTFVFNPRTANAASQEKFARRVFATAKKQGVELVGGAGFGFNTTRLYYMSAALTGPMRKPFVRIAAGTETIAEVDALIGVFKSAMI